MRRFFYSIIFSIIAIVVYGQHDFQNQYYTNNFSSLRPTNPITNFSNLHGKVKSIELKKFKCSSDDCDSVRYLPSPYSIKLEFNPQNQIIKEIRYYDNNQPCLITSYHNYRKNKISEEQYFDTLGIMTINKIFKFDENDILLHEESIHQNRKYSNDFNRKSSEDTIIISTLNGLEKYLGKELVEVRFDLIRELKQYTYHENGEIKEVLFWYNNELRSKRMFNNLGNSMKYSNYKKINNKDVIYNEITYNYDSSHNLITIVDSTANSIIDILSIHSFEYDSENKLWKKKVITNNVLTNEEYYLYNKENDIVSIADKTKNMIYSDYKYDKFNNWVSRIVTDKGIKIEKQERIILYYDN